MRTPLLTSVGCLLAVAFLAPLSAQRGGPPQPPATPRAAAPIDLTGYWVAIVNEDWRWRMVTPPKGDYASVPLNPAGARIADSWTPAQDGSCLAYGAAGLLRLPTRLHITWEGDDTLKLETDAGQQTRRLLFAPSTPPAARTLQGLSHAEWERPATGGRGAPGGGAVGRSRGPAGGTLRVTTTHLSGGWLRRNGVPYSDAAMLTEYFDRFPSPNGDEWLVVTTIVADRTYLTQDFVTSSHFKREATGARWSPAPCRAAD